MLAALLVTGTKTVDSNSNRPIKLSVAEWLIRGLLKDHEVLAHELVGAPELKSNPARRILESCHALSLGSAAAAVHPLGYDPHHHGPVDQLRGLGGSLCFHQHHLPLVLCNSEWF